MIFNSKSEKQTQQISKYLLSKILNLKSKKSSIVIGLEGELGAGKTVFVKGFAKALGIKSKIKSPTFAIMKMYHFHNSEHQILNPKSEINPKPKTQNPKLRINRYLYHIDAYRLKNHKDLISLGIKEILNNSENIVLIEWSDRVKKILTKKHIKIHIDHIEKNKRKIKISGI